MEVSLVKTDLSHAPIIHEMQIKAFKSLLVIYQDYETSPGSETVERIISRMNQSFTAYYIIHYSDIPVGAIRIVTKDNHIYRVSPIFIVPEYQGRGIAQKVFEIIEMMHSDAKVWELDTIMQERGNCYLYEKVGYKRTGKEQVINDKMTIVYYEKHLNRSHGLS